MDVPECAQAERWRPSLSALVDGELPSLPQADVDAHVAGCPACEGWLAEASALAHRVRVARTSGPDLTAYLIGVTEAHICACHVGGPCECTDCQCPTCTCGRGA